jgi:hypothetical protein
MLRVNRFAAFAIVALAFALAAGLAERANGAIQLTRAQIGIGIIIDVTPAPVAMTIRRAPHATGAQAPVPIHVAYNAYRIRPGEHRRVPSLRLSDGTLQVAQTQARGSIPVKANVSPNPNATLLYANVTNVEFGAVAGARTLNPCAFTVTIDTAITKWTLQSALTQDFISASSFPGSDLSFEMFASPGPSPRPSPEATTAFVVYPDNNNNPLNVETSGSSQVYCVDLTIFVPASTPTNSYSTTAVYTLQY